MITESDIKELKELKELILAQTEQLTAIDRRLNQLQEEFRVNTAVTNEKLSSLKENVTEIKGSQKAQIWTLIGILITATGGFLVAIGKFAISSNP